MNTLELRDGPDSKKVTYIKVTNPDNPSQFLYVETNLYQSIIDHLNSNGLSSFLGNVWNAVKGAAGGLITGGPLGAIGGAIVGYTSGSSGKPTVAVSPAANGQQQLTVTAPSSALVPAVVAPPPSNNNTLLWVGGGIAAALLLPKILRSL